MQFEEKRLESSFNDFKPALTPREAITEAERCLYCYDAPCIQACPTGINIPQFINRIATENTKGAAKTILDSNIFGLSCARSCPVEVLCEGACVYNHLNKKPIAIGKLQRFAVENAYEKNIAFYAAGKSNGKKVALVGAGPASFACAHELRILGYETIVYEKNQLPGGLNTHGIAPYKMHSSVSLQEISRILEMGVRVEYGKELNKNLELKTLLSNYDAVFLGLGLGEDSILDVPGISNSFTHGAVSFISKIKTHAVEKLAWVKNIKTALVVGGGNTALDACRELKGLGVARVIVSYRRGEAEMSGYKHEMNAAKQEGVEFWFYTLPTKFELKNVRLVRTQVVNHKVVTTSPEHVRPEHFQAELSERSNAGNVKKGDVHTTGSNVISLDVDLVLLATGQAKLEKLLTSIKELKFEKGKLLVNPKNFQTNHPKIFAAGDLVNGGMEVVNAVAEGKQAAHGIHKFLNSNFEGASNARFNN